ncbi:hypothetical protein [Olleya sp. YS]|uniref:hypothetical protein n=1 Tax=Olleya sp. YS TaxID=3028318 RepID=UPI0024342CAF|nr:hypothetical protein [Olleya sp. YS]WGD34651.1 hypothetical protein Ollyesu_12780 [Olleya sp. YS]
MNKFIVLILAVFIALVSCDGRDRIHKTPQEVLIENKLLDSFSENIKYFPKEYVESTTDTVLSNGFRVKIKTYTDMENAVLQSFTVDTIKNRHYFREVISEVVVFKENKQVFKQNIDDTFLSVIDTDYIINEMYLDEEKSLETNNLHLIASLCIPRTVNCPVYSIIIDKYGKYEVLKL